MHDCETSVEFQVRRQLSPIAANSSSPSGRIYIVSVNIEYAQSQPEVINLHTTRLLQPHPNLTIRKVMEFRIHHTNRGSYGSLPFHIWKQSPVVEVKCCKERLARNVFDFIHWSKRPEIQFYNLSEETPVFSPLKSRIVAVRHEKIAVNWRTGRESIVFRLRQSVVMRKERQRRKEILRDELEWGWMNDNERTRDIHSHEGREVQA